MHLPADGDAVKMAPLMCAGVTVHNGIRKMNITPGEVVAIQGLGGLGHLAVQYARKMGYRTVALSRGTDKKDFAMKLGATDYIDTSKEDPAEALLKMGGASLVVVTAPSPDHISPLVNGCKALGKVLILARKCHTRHDCQIVAETAPRQASLTNISLLRLTTSDLFYSRRRCPR